MRRNITDNNRSIALFDDIVSQISKFFDIKVNSDVEIGKDYFRRSACKYLFEFPSFSKDDVTICCRDTFFDYSYKKIGDKNNLMEDYYKSSHILGRFENISLCKNCNGYQKMDIEDITKLYSEKITELYRRRLETGVCFDLYEISGENSDVIDFLSKNRLTALTSYIEDKDILNKGKFVFYPKKELDMCVLWTRSLKCINGKIYSGCEHSNIEIHDFDDFLKDLKTIILI